MPSRQDVAYHQPRWRTRISGGSGTPSKSRSPCRVETVVPALFLILLFMLSFTMLSQRDVAIQNESPGASTDVGTGAGGEEPPDTLVEPNNPTSEFSYNLDEIRNPTWMASLPDDVSLAALSIPGTHDTLTHRLGEKHPRLTCQNHNLSTQLEAGIRYIDVRARLNISRSHVPGSGRPGNLLIYHSTAWTGYSFTDVMTTLFSFLDRNPSESVIMRLQREGPPVHVDERGRHRRSAGDVDETPWVIDRRGKSWGADPAFEAAFNYYRTDDQDTAAGFDKHFYLFPSSLSDDDKKVPTLGEARGKVVMLQDFDGAQGARNVYGLPWDESDPRLRIEDLWILTGPRDIERKWEAVSDALDDAAAEEDLYDGPLFLSHLSASVAVKPVEVAAGVRDPDTGEWHEGINDRTGKWLERRNEDKDPGKAGVLMADFPGKRLMEAIIVRNAWALDPTDGHAVDPPSTA